MKTEEQVKQINTDVDQFNCVKNPRLATGKRSATGWRWEASSPLATWRRSTGSNGNAGVMIIESPETVQHAQWVRRVPCKADQHYRVEVVASCECQSDLADAGLVFSLSPIPKDSGTAAPKRMVFPKITGPRSTRRAYLYLPKNTNSVELCIGLERASGWARVEQVLLLPIIEPEALSHPLACPPPPYACPAPKTAHSICITTDRADEAHPQRLAACLSDTFGPGAVQLRARSSVRAKGLDADALLLIDDQPPGSISSLRALIQLAEQRIVVVSLPAFARIAGEKVSLRTIVQGDDPIHAKVLFADYLTRGFALGDIFPYAWRADDRRCFVQRQIRRTPSLREWLTRLGFEEVLHSVCETDATSDHPICLLKRTAAGAIVVLDLEPLTAENTNFAEADLAAFLLRNVLGLDQATLGQYVVPMPNEKSFRDEVAEMGRRFPGFVVGGDEHPNHPRRDQYAVVGNIETNFGLPVPPRPLIVVRSGLSGRDIDGAYGAMFWFKQLLRGGQFACPYAQALIAACRLAWVPISAGWPDPSGWSESGDIETFDGADLAHLAPVGSVIDVTSGDSDRWRVVVPGPDERHWLVASLEAAPVISGGRLPHSGPGLEILVEVCQPSEVNRFPSTANPARYRIETPPLANYFPTESIFRTDLVAVLLERVMGLHIGLVAHNPTSRPIKVAWQIPSPNARVLAISDGKPVGKTVTLQPDGTLELPPGCTLLAPPIATT
jgi:hypothetical protein